MHKRKKAKPRHKISREELFDRIQKRAFELFLKKGSIPGNDWDDWFEAERQIKKELGLK